MTEQHKLLSIDGGGIRGVLALEILRRLETQLAEAHGGDIADFRLSDYFDYVSGTSTGAVIAACIARGMSVQEIVNFYEESGPIMFDNRWWKKAQSFVTTGTAYNAKKLEGILQDLFGKHTTLQPGNLKCQLLAVTRNQTTDSPWPISSNPKAKYNSPDDPDCNLNIPLWQIVRASAAAPGTFQNEVITLASGKSFGFLDGGVTPYNNSAWMLYRMATQKEYNMNYEPGEDKLLVVSVGTGSSPKGDDGKLVLGPLHQLLQTGKTLVGFLIQSSMIDQDTNCRLVGRCVHGEKLDSEIGDMIPRRGDMDPEDSEKNRIPLSEDLKRSFLYARYNVHLEQKKLDELGLHDIDVSKVRKLSAVENIKDLQRIGERVADEVNVKDFAPFLPR